MIKIWDKKEPINGKSADYILSYRDDLNTDEDVILITDKNNPSVVTCIALPSILKSNLNLRDDLSTLEVAETYLKHLEGQDKQTELSNQEKQSYEERIKALENTILELKEVI